VHAPARPGDGRGGAEGRAGGRCEAEEAEGGGSAETLGAAGPVLFVILRLGVVALVGRLLWRRWQRHNL